MSNPSQKPALAVGVYVMHCPSIPGRPEAAERVRAALDLDGLRGEPWGYDLVIDRDRAGAWHTAERCWRLGLRDLAEYVVVLNDDAALPRRFLDAALASLRAARERAPTSPVCFYTANDRAKEAFEDAGCGFYSTPDGLVGVGCGMHRDNVEAFLAWHAKSFRGSHTDDGRVNLWAMATGRRILTTLPSLVGHQLPEESTQGNAGDGFRTPAVPPPDDVGHLDQAYWAGRPVARFGRQYRGNHWRLLTNVEPADWKAGGLVERAYQLERER